MKQIPIARVAVMAVGAFLRLGSIVAAPPAVSIIDLGKLPGTNYSIAWDINSRGDVVGTSYVGGEDSLPFLWQHGVMTRLRTLGDPVSGAGAINDRGQILGYTRSLATGVSHAVLWQDGVAIDLGTLGGSPFSGAAALNLRGQVVGWSGTSYEPHAFLWQDGRMTDLGSLNGSSYSRAVAINLKGQVVGWSSTGAPGGNEYHAFLWQDGVMTDLGKLPGSNCDARFPCASLAAGINSRSQVVGVSSVTSDEAHAFLWQDGLMSDLGALPGSMYSEALAINDRGQIAGMSYFRDTQTRRAFLWQEGVMTDLGTLGGSNSEIGTRGSPGRSINSRGQLVGVSVTTENKTHAFLWQDDTMIDLGTLPGGSTSYANAINNQGQIVGFSDDGSGEAHAVMWTVSGNGKEASRAGASLGHVSFPR